MKKIYGYIIVGIGLFFIGYGINLAVHQNENEFLLIALGVIMVIGAAFYFKKLPNKTD
ncbi:hypothetical protein [Maribacter sp. 4U21]|uniref:hypothetical protein n=1 Tax=Maribacter sp. 4U21 TaxID=1889779 RepID=UPI0015D50A52|nr:hypothetical protein [Maribacter sp. 4U21]